MIDWLLSWPWPLILILTVGLFVAFSLAGLSVTRRFIMPRLDILAHQNEVTGFLHHGTLMIYGLAVALLAIAVWEKNSEVKKVISSEAVSIGVTYRDVTGYPEPIRSQLQAILKEYIEQIIHEAWPLMRRGKIPTAGVEIMNRFQASLYTFEPATAGQAALHQETLRAYNGLVFARRMRLDSVTVGLPAPMWVVVLLGGLMTVASSFFFKVEHAGLHQFMVLMVSMTMGLLIFLIAYYDMPYRGSHGLTPEAYELVHDQIMGKH
jgi:hypothetical protein